MPHDFQPDLDLIGRIAAIPTILDVICNTTGMGFAVVARVTPTRWIACETRDLIGFGLQPGGELKVESTICHEINQHRQAVVIDHVAEHPLFSAHHTPATYGFESYISVPIMLSDGRFFGTLCAIDPKPRPLDTPGTLGMFRLFAQIIAQHIEAQERLNDSEAALGEERQAAQLREQFIAVLGHDLRNPLASIAACLRMLDNELEEEGRATQLVSLAQNSVRRMSGLIDDVMDLARGRLADGIPVATDDAARLEASLRQVVAEAAAAAPNRVIEADIALTQTVRCDAGRIGQLCSNLLGNALSHGAADQPVRLRAATEGGWFEVSVTNGGEPIPSAALERLFQPYFRSAVRPGQQGLGLGLYIASEIARAHGGTLHVTSTEVETRFTFRMPCQMV